MENNGTLNMITTTDSFLEFKKNAFLAALYEKKFKTAEQVYLEIVSHAESRQTFDEFSEKLLNQIQTIFKKFRPRFAGHCSPGIEQNHNHLKTLILTSVKHASETICHISFSTWETRLDLSPHQKDLLYKTAMTFQLTSGCSNHCRRCNEWALPKVRSHFSHDAIVKILDQMAGQKNSDVSLYGASDPLDWSEKGKTISDILDHLDRLPIGYSLLTKVPRGKSGLLKTLLEKKANLSVSVTSKNKTRIHAIEKDVGKRISKQHDLDELLIPAGLDEDFSSIKPSITDGYGVEITPEGAFIIIPTFTSALHPFGHKKIPVTGMTSFFPVKKTGRDALLVDYFKPIDGYDLHKRRTCLTALLDVQIETIILDNGTDELTPPGMRSLKEYLSIFEAPARRQRKKMTITVLKRLKKQFLSNSRFKHLPLPIRAVYRKKIMRHLNLCKKENCVQAKLHAISFFLASVHRYQQTNPLKIKMMKFLLKDEISHCFASHEHLAGETPLRLSLTTPDLDAFDLFRFSLFCLLTPSKDKPVLDFISAHRARYDPSTDIFIPS